MNNLSNNLVLVLSVIALIVSVFTLWQIFVLNKLKKTFFAGQKAVNLEDVIISLKSQLHDSINHQQALEQELLSLKDFCGYTISKVGLVRYNPFAGSGGNFSFSLALLDSHNNGIVLTSMYGREQNRIYTKKIDNGKSESQFTEEELKAVQIANSTNH